MHDKHNALASCTLVRNGFNGERLKLREKSRTTIRRLAMKKQRKTEKGAMAPKTEYARLTLKLMAIFLTFEMEAKRP
jgi:hypothetical protein